jgi:hypothetical protein
VFRVHGVDCGKTLIGTHAVEECIDELSNSGLATRRLKRGIACPVPPVRMEIHPGTLLEISKIRLLECVPNPHAFSCIPAFSVSQMCEWQLSQEETK